MPETTDSSKLVHSRIRRAVFCTLVGLSCVLLFLLSGFQSWSVGIGIFFGFPMLLTGVGFYVAGVVRDLRRRDVL
jgi:4-hydroxybenzoate polyprenyltransferase